MAKKKKRNRNKGTPFNPETDTGIRRPVTARVAVGDVNDKFSDYPSNGLTPRRLARIFREADEGNVRAQMELFEEMEEKDTHLFSQMQTRKLAVTGRCSHSHRMRGTKRLLTLWMSSSRGLRTLTRC